MKIVTASNGKQTVKMSKADWKSIGKKAGWITAWENDSGKDEKFSKDLSFMTEKDWEEYDERNKSKDKEAVKKTLSDKEKRNKENETDFQAKMDKYKKSLKK